MPAIGNENVIWKSYFNNEHFFMIISGCHVSFLITQQQHLKKEGPQK